MCLFSFLGKQKNVDTSYLEAECFKIDPASKKVFCRSKQGVSSGKKEEFSVDYDYLVIATGAQSNTFNIPGVEENCHFLKVSHLGSYLFLPPLSILFCKQW